MSLRNPQLATIVYPETDGKPMAETDMHIGLMIDLRHALKTFFQRAPDVYVGSNLLVYYVEGNPRKCFAPDVFVVRGVGSHQRRTYKLWEEGRVPEVVIEISSRQTWGDDLQRKWKLYERLGVTEYFIFDPEYDYLMEPLVAYRLEAGEYASLEVKDGRVMSEALGLELVDTGETLRLFDAHAKRFLPIPAEEAEARSRAESEAATLRAEVEGLRQRLSSDS